MTKTILFMRPRYDPPTACMHYFSESIIGAIGKEYTIINLEGPKATKENFEKSIRKGSPRLMVLHGHGDKDSIAGHNGHIILEESNIHLLASTITYAVACDSAQELGEIAVKKGKADAYIGYEAQFMVVIDPTRSSTPSKDKNMKVFIKPYATTVLSLVTGRRVKAAIDDTRNVLRSLIREYGRYGVKDKYGDAPLIRFALYWNLIFLKGYGDLSSVVF
ncbi:MAG TPA: hypothetical protein VJB08_07370 [Candidatus Nanoarchaeia archaeon]|nr:hypothetical protein [Candidatus Nanoarchaeia archaeon]